MVTDKLELQTTIPRELSGTRLDQALAKLCPQFSRSKSQAWINAGQVWVNNKILKQKDKVYAGDEIRIKAGLQKEINDKPEKIPLAIIHEDEALLIINKPAGLVVHPGAGNPNRTLVNALLHIDKNLGALPRAGIIHRLDKDTTGIMAVARTPQAYTHLVHELQTRKIKREYQAIVSGMMTAGGSIENKLGRHPAVRTRMAVRRDGKTARTHYRIIKKFRHYTHIKVRLETGRTHQIRVHMAHIKHPVIGDPVYGQDRAIKKGTANALRDVITDFKRQALHAHKLKLLHPIEKVDKEFTADLPEDFEYLLQAIKLYDCK